MSVENVGELPLPPDRGNETEPKRVDGDEWWRGAVSETKLITFSGTAPKTSEFLHLCSEKHCLQAGIAAK